MTQNKHKRYKITIVVIFFIFFFVITAQANKPKNQHQQALEFSQEVSMDYLMNDVLWLADDARLGRASGTASEDEVAEWLIERYMKLDLSPAKKLGLSDFTHNFEYHVYDDAGIEHPAFGKNIIGVIPGSGKPNKYLIVSAHYDHLGVEDGLIYNGADDNATGVAAMLEVARVIKKSGRQPEKTIIFVSFSAEEIGRHGSWNFCHILHKNNIVDNTVGLNFEMFGVVKGSPMYVHVWEQQTLATQPIIQAIKTASDALNVNMITSFDLDPGSDALELLNCGVTATTIDVGGGDRFEYNHPYYHSPDDKVSNIDQNNFYQATQIVAMSVWLLAN